MIRLRTLIQEKYDTAYIYAIKFEETVKTLDHDERVDLVVTHTPACFECLCAVLEHPLAHTIVSLRWTYGGDKDIGYLVPLIIDKCPELTSLQVRFWLFPTFDFVSSFLEHPNNKIQELELAPDATGDLSRFFAALSGRHLTSLTLLCDGPPAFRRGLCDYLPKAFLLRFKVTMRQAMLTSVLQSLATCASITHLSLQSCVF